MAAKRKRKPKPIRAARLPTKGDIRDAREVAKQRISHDSELYPGALPHIWRLLAKKFWDAAGILRRTNLDSDKLLAVECDARAWAIDALAGQLTEANDNLSNKVQELITEGL